MKKVLIVASVVSFIEWFNRENIEFLRTECGCEVHIACNFNYMEDTDVDRTIKYIDQLKSEGVILHNIAFARSPFSKANVAAYKKLKRIIDNGEFDLIHCHTPTVSVLTRLAAMQARKKGAIVMYTCHGFHFHNSSPRKNWLIYYPIERVLSAFCDYIVTINKEDYARAKTFHCKNVKYIPGVGVDIQKIQSMVIDKGEKKTSIGVPSDSLLIVSAGELISRKNHEVIIRALARVNHPKIYYAIAGKGPLWEELLALAKELNLTERVMLLGFRTDILELYHAADISAFPSRIEGLGLAGIEAMSAGIPLVSSNVHGILDYVIDGETGYALAPDDVGGFANAIQKLADNENLRKSMKPACLKAVEPFDRGNALKAMWDIYEEVLLS